MAKRQMQIKGIEKASIKEIDVAAEAYVEARDERMQLTDREVESKDALIAAMKKHGVSVYRDESAVPMLVVTLVPGQDKVKVRRAEDDPEDGGGDEDAG